MNIWYVKNIKYLRNICEVRFGILGIFLTFWKSWCVNLFLCWVLAKLNKKIYFIFSKTHSDLYAPTLTYFVLTYLYLDCQGKTLSKTYQRQINKNHSYPYWIWHVSGCLAKQHSYVSQKMLLYWEHQKKLRF